jgi:CHAT domain-containing protein/tetratricopeptide (TPR) repeat protein
MPFIPDPRFPVRRCWSTLLLLIMAVPLSGQDAPTDGAVLTVGATVTATIAPGGVARWRVPMTVGEVAVIDVEQIGADVMVEVISPDGRARGLIDRSDVPEIERATWIADTTGEWLVVVTPFAEDGAPGEYAIAWRIGRPATDVDRQAVAADSLGNAALLLEDDGRLGEAEAAHREAIVLLEAVHGSVSEALVSPLADLARVVQLQQRLADAAPIYRRLLDLTRTVSGANHPDVAQHAMQLSTVLTQLARYPESEALIEEAIGVYAITAGDESEEMASALTELGRVQFRRGLLEAADSSYHRALALFRAPALAGHPLEAVTVNNLAVLYVDEARYQEASELYEEVARLNAVVYGPDHIQVAINYYNLASLYMRWARYDEAEPLLRRSLSIHLQQFGPDHPATARLYMALANLAEKQSNIAEAEQLYRRALGTFEAASGPGHPDVAAALTGLAHVAQRQERFEVAIEAYERALAILRAAVGPRHALVSNLLSDLAGLHAEWGDVAQAEALALEAETIDEAIYGPDHPSLGATLLARGRLAIDGERYADAVPIYSRALAIFEGAFGPTHPTVGNALIGVAQGLGLSDSTAVDSALVLLDRAVAIFERAPSDPTSAAAYVARATLRRFLADTTGALDDLGEALRIVDDQRAQIGGDEQTRARFFQRHAELFTEMVQWQLEAGDTTEAFTVAERGRARALLDQLAAGKIDLRQSIPVDLRERLEGRESAAEARMAELRQRVTMLRAREDLDVDTLYARIAELEDSLWRAEGDYRDVYAEIKNASPLWRDQITSGGRPSALRDVQLAAVPQGGVMLSYLIGSRGSLVFVVPPRGGRLMAVPLTVTENHTEALGLEAGPLTFDDLMYLMGGTALDTPRGARGGLFAALSDPARGGGSKVVGRARMPDPDEQLHALWRALLPDTVWQQVMTASEVVIIPDGPLHYLPFDALVTAPVSDPDSVTYWLDAGPPIRYAASATALVNITRRPADRVVQAAGPTMLSVSDAVFDPFEVASIRGDSAAGPPIPVAPTRGGFERGGGSLVRLPGTAAETAEIVAAFGANASERITVLSGIEATEGNLLAALDGKRFLHLATHGLVDHSRGGLFASLAFTPPSDTTSDLADDGFWQLHEIYARRLGNLELAVLSACESNIGRVIAGDGVFALSRGFVAAGAQRVVASQWEVDDASTAELISGFFRQVIEAETAGQQVGYATALRDAKLAVRRQARWSSPYFWAPFVLSGRQ